jgi:hypothetical protein
MWVQRSITFSKNGFRSFGWCINKSRSLITAVTFLVLAVDYGQAKTTSQLKNATLRIRRW